MSSSPHPLIGVYCGSSSGRHPEFSAMAAALGTTLAGAGLGVVYGGGSVGLMGIVADACLAAGGRVHGVITQHLWDREVGHRGLSYLDVVVTMHERKARMAQMAEGFVALPGGFGTWEELCEVITGAQLGLHHKPVVLLDVRGYWTPFLAMIDGAIDAGFMPQTHRSLVAHTPDVAQVIEMLRSPPAAPPPKWERS